MSSDDSGCEWGGGGYSWTTTSVSHQRTIEAHSLARGVRDEAAALGVPLAVALAAALAPLHVRAWHNDALRNLMSRGEQSEASYVPPPLFAPTNLAQLWSSQFPIEHIAAALRCTAGVTQLSVPFADLAQARVVDTLAAALREVPTCTTLVAWLPQTSAQLAGLVRLVGTPIERVVLQHALVHRRAVVHRRSARQARGVLDAEQTPEVTSAVVLQQLRDAHAGIVVETQ